MRLPDALSPSGLIARFRALGGVADNVSIRPGRHGQGLFAVNPTEPVRLLAPAHLLISPALLYVTKEGHVEVKPESGLGAELIAFHEHYQRRFSWGAGGFASISQFRQQLCALPARLAPFLQILGYTDDRSRHLTPSEAFKNHCISRQISVNGVSKLMPLLELINHANDGEPYVVTQEGVSLSGIFDDEVRARYTQGLDAFHFFFNYHFAVRSRSTLSCEVRIEVPGFKSLRISRMDGLFDVKGGVRVPQVSSSADELHFSFVELINLDKPSSPRQVFTHLLKDQGMQAEGANGLFDGLLMHNRQVMLDFLEACEGSDGQVLLGLREVAGYQLAHLLKT